MKHKPVSSFIKTSLAKLGSLSRRGRFALYGVLTLAVGGATAIALTSASGTIYLTPATGSVENGSNVTLQVRTNASAGNTAQVDISYPSDKFDFVGYDKTGGVLPNEVGLVNTPGTFKLSLYVNPGDPELSGQDVLLLTITLKAKADSGTGTVSMLPSAAIVDQGTASAGPGTGADLTFTAPANPPQPTPGTIYLTPATGSVENGSNVTLQVRTNASAGNTAQVDISYPSDKFDFVGYDKTGGVLPNEVGLVNTPGTFKLSLYVNPGDPELSGQDVLLLTITLKAKADSGTGTVSMLPSAAIVDQGTTVSTIGASSTITLTAGSTTPPPTTVGSMYIAPATMSVNTGASITLQVRSNATSGNAAEVNIVYPSDKFDFVSYSTTDSVFPNEIGMQSAAGSLSVSLYATPGGPTISGDSQLLLITLKAKTVSGTGTVSLSSGSKVVMGNAITATPTTGTTITLTTPPPLATPTPTPTPKPSQPAPVTKPPVRVVTSTPTPVLTEATPNPVFSILSVTASAKGITWKTEQPTTGIVKYGPSIDNLYLSAKDGNSSTDHAVTIDSDRLNLGSNYYFVITATDTSGKEVRSDQASASIPPARLIIKDKNGKVITGAIVELNSVVYTPSEVDGVIEVSGVLPGTYSMIIKKDGKILATQDATLVAGATDAQDLALPISSERSITPQLTIIGGAVLAALLMLGGAVAIFRRRQPKAPSPNVYTSPYGGSSANTVISPQLSDGNKHEDNR